MIPNASSFILQYLLLSLTFNLPTTTIVAQPFNVIKWQLKFKPAAWGLRSFSSCLILLLHLLFPVLPSVMCFRRHFLRKCYQPTYYFFSLLCVERSFLPSLCVMLHFSHDRSNWSFPSLCSITFQKFQGNSDLFWIAQVSALHNAMLQM